jgi:hypothetical protein
VANEPRGKEGTQVCKENRSAANWIEEAEKGVVEAKIGNVDGHKTYLDGSGDR